jgi:lantibiotic modifying enzyme
MSDEFLAAAWSIGAQLCRDALWADDRCNWLGDSMEFVDGDWRVVHRAFGADLYAGTSGIALFLARLHGATGEVAFRTTALGAARHAISCQDAIDGKSRCGFYSGLIGIAYALTDAGHRLQAPELTEAANAALRDVTGDEIAAAGVDVVSGSAGAIPALLLLQQHHPTLELIELATGHGRRLIEIAQPEGEGKWSWDTLGTPGQRNLTGFSHGAAGIGWALLELHHATGASEFADGARHAFAYERHWFVPAQDNWPDLRSIAPRLEDQTPSCTIAWCHGAPGIGLSRLRAWRLTGEAAALHEVDAALRCTSTFMRLAASGGPFDFSLCHGLSGDADLFIEAGQYLDDPAHLAFAREIGRAGIARYSQLAWPCGIPGGGEAPNLMLGLAGIGHFFLRLHNPATTPSVLIVGPGTGI